MAIGDLMYRPQAQFAPTEVDYVETTGIPQFDDRVVRDIMATDLRVQQEDLTRLEDNITKLGAIEDEVLGYKLDNEPQKLAYQQILQEKGLSQQDLLRLDPNDPTAVYDAQRKIKAVMSDPRLQNIEREKQIAAGVAKQYSEGKLNLTPGMQKQFLKDFEDYKLGNKSAMELNPNNYKYTDYNTDVDKILKDLEPDITSSLEQLPQGGTYTKEIETLSKDRIKTYMSQAIQNPQYRNSLLADGIIEIKPDGTVGLTPQGEQYINTKAETFAINKETLGDFKPLTEAQRKEGMTPEEIAAEKARVKEEKKKEVKDTYVKDITAKIKGKNSGEVVTAVNLLYDNYDLQLTTSQAAELQAKIIAKGKDETTQEVADRYAADIYLETLPKAQREKLILDAAKLMGEETFGLTPDLVSIGEPRIEGDYVIVPVTTDAGMMSKEKTKDNKIKIDKIKDNAGISSAASAHFAEKAAAKEAQVQASEAAKTAQIQANAERVKNTAKDLRGLIAKGEGSTLAYNRGVAGDTTETLPQGISLGDIMSRQSLSTSDPNRIFAVGKYQVIPSTMREAVSALGIDRDQPFTEEVEDQIFDYLITAKRPEIGQYILGGEADLDKAILELSKEFASVGVPYDVKNNKGVLIKKGDSYYSGQSGNKASISPTDAKEMLKKERERRTKQTPQEMFQELKGIQDSRTAKPSSAANKTTKTAGGEWTRDEWKSLGKDSLQAREGRGEVEVVPTSNQSTTAPKGNNTVSPKQSNKKVLNKEEATKETKRLSGIYEGYKKNSNKDSWSEEKKLLSEQIEMFLSHSKSYDEISPAFLEGIASDIEAFNKAGKTDKKENTTTKAKDITDTHSWTVVDEDKLREQAKKIGVSPEEYLKSFDRDFMKSTYEKVGYGKGPNKITFEQYLAKYGLK